MSRILVYYLPKLRDMGALVHFMLTGQTEPITCAHHFVILQTSLTSQLHFPKTDSTYSIAEYVVLFILYH